FRKSYRCLAPLGRLVCFGLSGAATGMGPSRLAALKRLATLPWFHPIRLMNDNKAVIGVNLGHLWDRIELLRGEMLALLADYEAGRIKPVVGKTFPLAEAAAAHRFIQRSEEHTELQSLRHLVCRLLLEKKKKLPAIYMLV